MDNKKKLVWLEKQSSMMKQKFDKDYYQKLIKANDKYLELND